LTNPSLSLIITDIFGNLARGDYGTLSGKPARNTVSKGISLSKNFNDLNPRIKVKETVKALMPPETPIIEELDD
jgi:hypothetical protein